MMKLAAWGPILTRALARVLSLPLAATLAACQPGLATTTSFADDIESVLAADLTYRIGASGVAITVPRGFVTDFASIPQPLWSILSPHGRYSRAAIVHDYLYWSQSCTRDQADNLFMIAMQESGVADSDRTAIYQAVSWAGEDAWDANRAERAQGLPRIIPADRLPIPADLTWPDFASCCSAKVCATHRWRRAPPIAGWATRRLCRGMDQELYRTRPRRTAPIPR